MRFIVLWVCGLMLLSGCAKRVSRLQVQAVGKVFLNPSQGDKLTWVDSHHEPLPVTFLYGSPCREGDVTSTCTVNVSAGFYKYKCDGCIDPGVGVGSSSGALVLRDYKPHGHGVNSASTPDPFIYCDHGKAAAESVEASVGDRIQWFGAGTITTWTVTVAANTCDEGTTFTQNSPICTIKSGAITHPYQVQVPACTSDPTGQSTLTIR